jgi:EmrB/QacA subfamily drug resistance transporter
MSDSRRDDKGTGGATSPGADAAPAAAGARPDGWPRWRVFPPIALGVIMATLDASVVNIALPTLQRTLHAGLSTVEWVSLAYSLTLTGLLLAAGRFADAHGRRNVYGGGLLLFTLASLLCGSAPSVEALIGLRVFQGLGAALLAANGSALLVQAFPIEERGRALGAFGAMVGVGLAVGPPLGGLIVAHASWRWIFFLNLPLGLLSWALLKRRVPPDSVPAGAPKVDFIQPVLWASGLAGLMLALTRGPESGWTDPLVLACAAGGALLLGAFLVAQSGSRDPLLPLDLVVGPLGAAVSLTFLGQLLSVSVGFHMPLVLEETGGLSAAQSGAWLAVLPVAALFCAPVAGRLADRLGARTLTVTGMALSAIGMWLLANLGAMPAGVRLAAGLTLIGVGQGLFAVPNASALLTLVPHERLGLASGLQSTTRNLGLAAGVAFTGAMVTARYHAHAGTPLHLGAAGGVDRGAFVLATHETFTALALLGLLATWLAWRVRAGRPGGTAPVATAGAAAPTP